MSTEIGKPDIVAVVGQSNSGKTTFIENLIPLLKNKGYRVGVVKHTHHNIEIDREGKDSWRHRKAGADTVILSSPKRHAVIRETDREFSLDDIAGCCMEIDLLIAEGYKKSDKPKIEVFRKEAHGSPVCIGDPMLIAMISDAEPDVDVPVFSCDAYQEIADYIESEVLKKN